ncbi:GlcG/HbpS family heme-binding protein [Nocardia fluminea]|uniref:GlcG/HbpS family heme-binding protein n=1 Tax=Nocardia fluminea TaxID=134984 RepID=UPI00340510DD
MTRTLMTADAVGRAVQAAIEAARADGTRICVAVVDHHGHDVMLVRDGAAGFTAGVARAKATTAALLGMPTTVYSQMSEAYPELRRVIEVQAGSSVTSLPGGVPVDAVAGAVGVSGAHPDQDVRYAEIAAAHLANEHRAAEAAQRRHTE